MSPAVPQILVTGGFRESGKERTATMAPCRAKRAPIRLATAREAQALLRAHGLGGGDAASADARRLVLGTVGRALRKRGCVGTGAAIRAALQRMKQKDQQQSTADVQETGTARVASAAAASLQRSLLKGQVVDVALLRGRFHKQWRQAGGTPEELTRCVKRLLYEAAMRDELPRRRGRLLVLFSGYQSATRPAERLGLQPINAELQPSLTVSSIKRKFARVTRTTDLSKAGDGRQVQYACKRQRVPFQDVSVVQSSLPCETFSSGTHCNTSAGSNCQYPSGHPRASAKTQKGVVKTKASFYVKAVAHRRLGKNMAESVVKWVKWWACRGYQAHYYLEHGQKTTLKLQGFMKELQRVNPAQPTDYCQYKVFMHRKQKHVIQKRTSIWTNIRGWIPRLCPGVQLCHHDKKLSGMSKDRPRIMDMTTDAVKNYIPEELHYDLLKAAEP